MKPFHCYVEEIKIKLYNTCTENNKLSFDGGNIYRF